MSFYRNTTLNKDINYNVMQNQSRLMKIKCHPQDCGTSSTRRKGSQPMRRSPGLYGMSFMQVNMQTKMPSPPQQIETTHQNGTLPTPDSPRLNGMPSAQMNMQSERPSTPQIETMLHNDSISPPLTPKPNGMPSTQANSPKENETQCILPETCKVKDTDLNLNAVESLLQRSLDEKVISEGPDKFRYFCCPCGTEVLGSSNIKYHIVGKKHANFSFYEVMKNPIFAPSVLKEMVPKVALDATMSQLVIGLSPSTFKCGLCDKVLNGVKPLVQHLEFHRGDSMLPYLAALKSDTLAVRESSETDLFSQHRLRSMKMKVLLLEYSISGETGGAHVQNLMNQFKHLVSEIAYFMNLSVAETNEKLFDLSNPEDSEEFEAFVCVITGTGYYQTFYNSSHEEINFSEVVSNVNNNSSRCFREKSKVFLVDIHSNDSVLNIMVNINSNDPLPSWTVLKNTTMIIASTAQDETIFIPSLSKNITENPKLELQELYLKICVDFDKSLDRVEYHNYQAKKFSFQ